MTTITTEVYWTREIITDQLDWLGDEMCRRTGQPRTAAGTKGDTNHLRGGHRSQEWIKKSAFCTDRAYTTQAGLTDLQVRYIGAFDFTPGSAAEMVAQCKRIMAAMKAGHLDEVVEFYGNVDGDQVVDGWDNLHDRAASSDSSHLWHWHITFNRLFLASLALMQRIVAIALGDDMPLTTTDGAVLLKTDAITNPKWRADSGTNPLVTWGFAIYDTWERAHAAQVAAEKTSAQLAALTAAVQAMAAGGTSVDTAAVIAAVNQVGDELAAELAEVKAERDHLNARLAAALTPAT